MQKPLFPMFFPFLSCTKAFQKNIAHTSFERRFAAKKPTWLQKTQYQGDFWNNWDAKIKTMANNPFERNGLSQIAIRHVTRREKACHWQRNGLSLSKSSPIARSFQNFPAHRQWVDTWAFLHQLSDVDLNAVVRLVFWNKIYVLTFITF